MLRFLLILNLAVAVASWAQADPVLVLDFEGLAEPEECGRFQGDVVLAQPGYQSKQCLARRAQGTYCSIRYDLPKAVALTPDSRLRFAHRVASEGDVGYIGINVFTLDGKVSQGKDSTGSDWRVCDVGLIGVGPAGHAKNREPLAVGDQVTGIALYGRMRKPGELVTFVDDIALVIPGAEPMELVPAPSTSSVAGEAGLPLKAGERFEFDFERADETAYPQFERGSRVTPGFESEGAWSISGDKRFLELHFDCDFILRENMWLEVDSKVLTAAGRRLYIGLYFIREDEQKRLNSSIASTEEWEPNASRDLLLWPPAGHSPIKKRGVIGEHYTKGVLYSKLAESAPQTMSIDNLRLVCEGEAEPADPVHTTIHRAATVKVIDGLLSDWTDLDGEQALVIGEAAHAHEHTWYQGPQDASALVYLLHSDDSLYAAFCVSDDVVRNTAKEPDGVYQGDCCLLGLAPARADNSTEFARVYMFSPGDFGSVAPVLNVSRGDKRTEATFATRRTADGYTVEARIPLNELTFTLAPGTVLRLETMLYDADQAIGRTQREGIFTWSSVDARYNASQAGFAHVEGQCPAPIRCKPGELRADALIQTPIKDPDAFAVRPVTRTIAEAGIPLAVAFTRDDVPTLRKRVADGEPASDADVLIKTVSLYLDNVRPGRWHTIDAAACGEIEEAILRLSFAHVLTEDPRYAELARRAALKVAALPWPDAGTQSLQRAFACALDWLGHALTDAESATLCERLPEGSPPQRIVPERQPASRRAAEVWAMISGESAVAADTPGRGTGPKEAPSAEESRRLLSERIEKRRQTNWQPFDREVEQPILAQLLGRHPRLLCAPDRLEEIRLRGSAIPESLWHPTAMTPHTPAPPSRRGNSGSPGYDLIRLAASYLATGRDYYAQDAIRVMLGVCSYPHWGGHNHLPADVDLDAGALLMGVGIAYDTFFYSMTPDQRDIIRAKLVKQARRMYGAHSRRDGWSWDQNHTYIDNGGLWCTAVALYDEVDEARDWYAFGTRVLKNAMHVLNGTDGAFYEGIAYWGYGMAMHFVPLLDLFRNVTGVDTFGYFRWQAQSKYYLLHTLMPGGRYQLNLGDTSEPTALPLRRAAMLKTASEYRDPDAQGLASYFAEEGSLRPTDDAWTLLWWDPSVPARDPRRDWPPHHHFTDLDIVCFRDSWDAAATMLGLRCGPASGHRAKDLVLAQDPPDWIPGTGHVHPDLNHFVIFDHGEFLAIDPGYTVLKRTRNHNTIAVDGGGQIGDGHPWPRFEPWDRFGRIAEVLGCPGTFNYLRGEAAQGYQPELELRQFDRHIIMMPDQNTTWFLVHDQLSSAKPQRYEWLLHSKGQARAGPHQRYAVTTGRRALTARLLQPDALESTTEEIDVEPPPWSTERKRGWRLVLHPKSNAQDVTFTAVLTCHAADRTGPRVERVADGVIRVEGDGWVDVAALAGSGGGVESDGHHATVRIAADTVGRWGVIGATRLSWAGNSLFDAEAAIAAGCMVMKQSVDVWLNTSRAQTLGFLLPFVPSNVQLDGAAARFTFDGATGRARIAIPAGTHAVRIQ